jgi:hypothetical protein
MFFDGSDFMSSAHNTKFEFFGGRIIVCVPCSEIPSHSGAMDVSVAANLLCAVENRKKIK